MGCTSSSLQYREVYEKLYQRLGFSLAEMRSTRSSVKAIHFRTSSFAIIGNDLSRETGTVPSVCERDQLFLPQPTPVEAGALVRYAKESWLLADVHPLCIYVGSRAVEVLNVALGEQDGGTRLRRTAFRLWLLMICETIHFLAVLQEQNGLPKAVRRWLRKVERIRAVDVDDAFADGSRLLRDMRALTIDLSGLKPGVLAQLRDEFPGALPSDVPVTADELLEIAQAPRGGHPGAGGNPLQVRHGATGVATVPFFALAEGIVTRQVLALRGPEEDPTSYAKLAPPPPPSQTVSSVGAACPPLALDEVGNPEAATDTLSPSARSAEPETSTPAALSTTVVSTVDREPEAGAVVAELPPGRRAYQLLDLLAWGDLLCRYDEIHRELLALPATPASGNDCGAATSAREELESERAAIAHSLRGLFSSVSKGVCVLDCGQAAEGMWDTFDLPEAFGSAAAVDHETLSDLAFHESDHGETCGAIDTVDRFGRYLGLYIHLYNLYAAACKEGHREDRGTIGIGCLTEEEMTLSLAALPLAQQHQVALAADPSQGACHDGDQRKGEEQFCVLFELLAEWAAESPTGGGSTREREVPFTSLCQFVAHAIASGEPLVALHDLAELRWRLGLDRTGREGEMKSAAFLRSCCDAAMEDKDTGFASTVGRLALLARFAPSPTAVATMATSFSTTASTFPANIAVSGSADTARACFPQVCSMTSTRSETEGESFLALSSFFTHALYNTAAIFRCAGECCLVDAAAASPKGPEVTDSADHGSGSRGGSRAALLGDTQMSRKWFAATVRRAAVVLGCPVSDLLESADAILSQRAAAAAATTETARAVCHNKIPPPVAKSMEERTEGEADDVVVLLDRAFRELGAVDHAAGMHGGTVLLEDLVYVCLFNAMRPEFEEESLFSTFFLAPFPFNASGFLADLFAALPLGDEEKQYLDFFLFSGGKRAVPFDLAAPGSAALEGFVHAMYACYEKRMAAVAGNEIGFARWFRHGLAHVKGPSGEFTARDYAALLEYLSGQFVAFARHRGNRTAVTAAASSTNGSIRRGYGGNHGGGGASSTENIAHDAVRRKFIEELLLFPQCVDTTDARTRERTEETAKRVFTELQLSEMETRNGDVSLGHAADWYGTHRVASMPTGHRSPMELWLLVARQLPYTSSLPHRKARRAIAKELREVQREMQTEDGTEPGLDSYLVAESLVDKCVALYGREGISLMPSCTDAESWLRGCVRRSNGVVGRSDLGDGEVHEQDLRFFFAFMHYDMTVFCALQEAEKEMRAVLALRQAGRVDATFCEGDTQNVLRAAFERCLRGELKVPRECVDALLHDDGCVARFCAADGVWDAEGLAHHVAGILVAHDHALFLHAQQEYREDTEAKVLAIYEKELLLGRGPHKARTKPSSDPHFRHGTMTGEPIATYWERLRHLLPHGISQAQRALRQRLWDRVDTRAKGYATLADLHRGLLDVLRLNEFRDDIAPVLFRAFSATTEMYAAQSDVIYLTGNSEQILLPSHFRVLLLYLFRYMELYFMFDVLTCSGFLDGQTRAAETATDPSLGGAASASASAVAAAAAAEPPPQPVALSEQATLCRADVTVAAMPHDASPAPLPSSSSSSGDVLFEASLFPYAVMKASAPVRKQVTLAQFRAARRLLRHWGVHVKDSDSAFRDINRRTKETGEMYFTGFAIWASEMGLHPEGYGYDFTEDADEVAAIEARLGVSADDT